jgi:hypothetical protein
MDYNAELLDIIDGTEKDRLDKILHIFDDYNLPKQDCIEIYQKCNSFAQTTRSERGKDLEIATSLVLDELNIRYKQQVNINEGGMVIEKKKRGCFRVDFVVCPKGLKIGHTINESHIIISCKRSLRERANQEAALHKYPDKFCILTTTNEKPKNVSAEIFSTSSKCNNFNSLIQIIVDFQNKFICRKV